MMIISLLFFAQILNSSNFTDFDNIRKIDRLDEPDTTALELQKGESSTRTAIKYQLCTLGTVVSCLFALGSLKATYDNLTKKDYLAATGTGLFFMPISVAGAAGCFFLKRKYRNPATEITIQTT